MQRKRFAEAIDEGVRRGVIERTGARVRLTPQGQRIVQQQLALSADETTALVCLLEALADLAGSSRRPPR